MDNIQYNTAQPTGYTVKTCKTCDGQGELYGDLNESRECPDCEGTGDDEMSERKLWECPSCGFSFSTAHEDVGGGYSCPVCENVALQGANKLLVDERDKLEDKLKMLDRMAEKLGAEQAMKIKVLEARAIQAERERDELLKGLQLIDEYLGTKQMDDSRLWNIYTMTRELLTQYDTAPKEDKTNE